jgi:rare lipoprotein A
MVDVASTRHKWLAVLLLLVCASACTPRVPARAPTAVDRALETREGLASYYGKAFHGKVTASGRRFDMDALVAAHPSYPFGTLLRVTNLDNGRTVQVRVQDRGPAARPRAEGVIIDVSRRTADVLGFVREGRARVRVEVLAWTSDR